MVTFPCTTPPGQGVEIDIKLMVMQYTQDFSLAHWTERNTLLPLKEGKLQLKGKSSSSQHQGKSNLPASQSYGEGEIIKTYIKTNGSGGKSEESRWSRYRREGEIKPYIPEWEAKRLASQIPDNPPVLTRSSSSLSTQNSWIPTTLLLEDNNSPWSQTIPD